MKPPAERVLAALLACVACGLGWSGVAAHEFAPGLLSLTERAPGTVDVLWKYPARSTGFLQPLPVAGCERRADLGQRRAGPLVVEQWQLACAGPLAGSTVGVEHSGDDTTAVLLSAELHGGRRFETLLRPGSAQSVVPATVAPLAVIGSYLGLGVGHILRGYDHLLFVLGLLLIVRRARPLILTVTAFTAGHSVTLALATLGGVRVPGAPVEACIALSIVILAREALRENPASMTRRLPWLVAGTFGLLHGLGFAGALVATGLPPDSLPLALLGFNAGVELGQIAFIAAALVALRAWIRLRGHFRPTAVAYAMGTFSTFLLIQRVASW